jgi:hypothetical protein
MTTANHSVIVLNRTSGQVTVEPEDEDRFVISAQEAVKACRNELNADQAIRTFKQEFLAPLRAWCETHSSRVEACFVPPPTGHLAVYVIGVSDRYDFALGDEIAALELALADRGWRVGVMHLPNGPDEYLLSHFNPEGAIKVYGHAESTPG